MPNPKPSAEMSCCGRQYDSRKYQDAMLGGAGEYAFGLSEGQFLRLRGFSRRKSGSVGISELIHFESSDLEFGIGKTIIRRMPSHAQSHFWQLQSHWCNTLLIYRPAASESSRGFAASRGGFWGSPSCEGVPQGGGWQSRRGRKASPPVKDTLPNPVDT